jgi:GntR family transcriptional regulator
MNMARLDKRNPIPLYHQLQAIVAQRITSGEWPPGRQIPSERELCVEFGVSRITVRQALAALTNEGWLARHQGVGTFVAPSRIEQQLSRLTGFTDEMEEHGQPVSSRLLRLEQTPASYAVVHSLGLKPGDLVVVVQRLRLVGDEPLALETAYLPGDLCHGLLDEPLASQSLYRILIDKYSIVPTRADQQIEAVACPLAEASLLGVRKGMPVLRMIRVSYDQDGRPFEHTESFYRGDRYIFRVELVATGEGRAGSSAIEWRRAGAARHGRSLTDTRGAGNVPSHEGASQGE